MCEMDEPRKSFSYKPDNIEPSFYRAGDGVVSELLGAVCIPQAASFAVPVICVPALRGILASGRAFRSLRTPLSLFCDWLEELVRADLIRISDGWAALRAQPISSLSDFLSQPFSAFGGRHARLFLAFLRIVCAAHRRLRMSLLRSRAAPPSGVFGRVIAFQNFVDFLARATLPMPLLRP